MAKAQAADAGAAQSRGARSGGGQTQAQAASQSDPDQAARARRKSERGSFLAETAAHLQRLDRVSFPILAENAEFCRKKQAPLTGLRIWNVTYFDELEPGVMAPGEDRDTVWQEAAKDVLGLGEAPQVLSVGAGSPAEKAGLRVDDVILAINGETIEPSPKAAKRARKMLEEAVGDGWSPVYIEYGRSGKTGQAVLEPVIGCKHQMLVDPREEVAAWADRKRVTVTYGMMKLARTDKELAYVVSREMAHSLFGDDRRDQRRTQDAAEADYLGSYLYARAGYPVKTSDHHGIRQAWHLMRHAQPVELGLKGHAPTLTKRAAMVNEAAAEIESKQMSQQPLIPGDAESWVEARLRAPEPTGGSAPSPAPGPGESLAAKPGSGVQGDQPTDAQGGRMARVQPGNGGGGTEQTSQAKAERRPEARRRKPRVVNESPADVTDVETVDAYNQSLPDVPDILRAFQPDSADRL